MKTIDLSENLVAQPSTLGKNKKYYPSIGFSDKGVGGVSSFDDKDIGKTISVNAEIKLVGINSNSTDTSKGKSFNYVFEVRKIHMPDDLSKKEDDIKQRRAVRESKK